MKRAESSDLHGNPKLRCIKILFRVNRRNLPHDWKTFQFLRFRAALSAIRKNPRIALHYFELQRDRDPQGEALRRLEDTHVQALREIWLGYHRAPADIESIRLANRIALGTYWALAADRELWLAHSGPDARLDLICAELTEISTSIIRLKTTEFEVNSA